MVHVLSMGFEKRVFAARGMPFRWQSWQEQVEAADALDTHLEAGRPALLLTDTYPLPYFKSSPNFPGHVIVTLCNLIRLSSLSPTRVMGRCLFRLPCRRCQL